MYKLAGSFRAVPAVEQLPDGFPHQAARSDERVKACQRRHDPPR